LTGEKDRYTTHEKLWKLEDGQLSTPKHDELVLQLLYKENAKKILSMIYEDMYCEEIEDKNVNVDSEVLICTKNDFIVGYVDVKIKFDKGSDRRFLCIEAKPEIESFGQTLRQINTYRKYCSYPFIIYTPDTKFRNAFITQGIWIITPEDLGLK
jgi:hypothetical protein